MTRTAESIVQLWVQDPPDAPFGWWLGFMGVLAFAFLCIVFLVSAVTSRD